MKRIAMIGATGLLGKPVALALANAGYEVTALVRDPGPARKTFPKEIKIFPGDMRSDSDLKKTARRSRQSLSQPLRKAKGKENRLAFRSARR
ncbi:MAG: NmrA family NAD(P)-binding protein [Bacteroidota bacterium]